MSSFVLSHKKGFFLFVCAWFVFIGCCAFPVINLTKAFPLQITLLNLFTVCISCVYLGKIMEIIFSKKITKSILIALSMTMIGFLCRYLLEYGEVSNTYNFTLPNIALHLLITGILILFLRFKNCVKKAVVLIRQLFSVSLFLLWRWLFDPVKI